MSARSWFLTVAFAALAVAELALAPALAVRGAGPDFLLPLAVYVALANPWTVSPLFYFGLGTFSDLLAMPHPGLRGFTYLAVAMSIESIGPTRWRRSAPGRAVFTLVAALCVECIYAGAVCRSWPGGLSAALVVAAIGALETGLVALVLSWPLDRLARAFSWTTEGRSMSWAQAVAAAGAGAPPSPRRRERRR